jgi:hypothetical protein
MSDSLSESYSGSAKINQGPCSAYGCNRNLSSSDPASQYQRLKLIQKTVRVPSSLYSMNLAALNVYQLPYPQYKVNWNQMSDRRERHYQPTIVTGGSTYHGSSTKSTITRCRPGAGCPGGYGVDIKHNSYDRYLNRIKGKGPVRRGVIPPNFGSPIYNLDPSIQGGKTMKTSIVSGCNCPIISDYKKEDDKSLYITLCNPFKFDSKYSFFIGQKVYAILLEKDKNYYEEATVTAINDNIYTIEFQDGTIAYRTINNLLVYFPCNCSSENINDFINTGNYVLDKGILLPCYILNNFVGGGNYINIINILLNNNSIV